MEQYISKDALVTEIERLISNGKLKCQQSQENNDQVSYAAWSEHIATCGKILSFLSTLEVKEVDLEKEIDFAMPSRYCWSGDGKAVYTKEQMRNFAKHFFALGMQVSNKAQKGKEV